MSLPVAITFDVWETLLHDSAEAEDSRIERRAAGMARALAAHGHPVEPAALVAAYHEALPGLEAFWATHRDLDTPEQVSCVLRRLSPPLVDLAPGALAQAAEAYARVALELPPDVDPDAAAVLADVKARGLRVGLICNTGRTPGWVLRELFRRAGILDYFEVLAFSNEERIRKPDPEIFRRVLGRLDVPAERSVHVGDDAVTDIAGAKHVGMRAVLVWTPHSADLPVQPDAALPRLGGLPALLDAWD